MITSFIYFLISSIVIILVYNISFMKKDKYEKNNVSEKQEFNIIDNKVTYNRDSKGRFKSVKKNK